ncbi:uncharacterized protein CPUR_03332 [Claviceps purpurea 20.1]|uniref:PWI domain-containing protein n=1 Tax=Claviceps purpurea (strain 20.1) TaxID=1111077 RepID=M1WHB3_CLAP2|nr:uncharacterized protein CPUR_03332 [Claviceps purpurea 20.1]
MASKVDAQLLRSTKFPPEFRHKVDMQKVNLQVMKKWIANRISDILGNEDDVVIELCFNLIEGSRHPDIKSLQIQLTGFLDKDTAQFCKELWNLLLSAQGSPQGVPKELLEAKKLELMQEKMDADRAADDARKQRQDADLVPDEGSRIAQAHSTGRRRLGREAHGTRLAVISTFRTLGVAVTASGSGDAIHPLPQSIRPARDREAGTHLVRVTHPKVLPVEDALLPGIVATGKGRGHPVEMRIVHVPHDVMIETIDMCLLDSLDLCLPTAARQR